MLNEFAGGNFCARDAFVLMAATLLAKYMAIGFSPLKLISEEGQQIEMSASWSGTRETIKQAGAGPLTISWEGKPMRNTHSFYLVLLVFSLAVAFQSTIAQVVIATVPVGNGPWIVAVNPVTDKIYVANSNDNTISVIDGATNNTTSVNVGVYPYAVAVNAVTNKIYVANKCGNDPSCNSPGTVTVIDGATNNTTTVNVGVFPYAVAVNPVTNQIYVVNHCGNDPSCHSPGTVTVIDGATLSTTNVAVGYTPKAVAVNEVTNKIYVANRCGNDPSCHSPGTVTVIDGATNNTSTVNVGVYPNGANAVAVDSVTNQIYVSNNCGNDLTCSSPGTVTVIDGATNNTTTVNVGFYPYGVAVNAVTNKIYVANASGNDPTGNSPATVTVIDGATNNTTTVNVGFYPYGVAVNAVTNEIYVINLCGNDPTCNSAATVSVLNGVTNSVVPVAVGDTGSTRVLLAVNATTDRIYVPNSEDGTVSVIAGDTALQFVTVPPCRVVDTRKANGTFGGPPIQGGNYRSFPIPQSSCNIPTDAATYSLNVTVVPHGPLGYLTIWPAGENRPVVSTMNSVDGRVKADAAIVPAGSSGEVSVYVTNTTDVILDIDGYFAPMSGSTYAFYPLPPCRVADTRKSDFPQGLGPPQLFALTSRDFPVLNSTCIPSGVSPTAYSFNFTVVPGGHPVGYLSAWPTGQSQPVVSTLNDQTGTIVANAAIVPAGTGGDISVYSTNDTQLLIDINGYFAPAGQGGLSLYPAVPCRVIDTRKIGTGLPFSGILSPPVDVVGSLCGVPSAAQAYVFNATVVPTGALGYLTLWPDGTDQPVVSTLNAFDGALTNNMAIVPTNNGKVDAFANGITQLILDISSYFAP
jgi:YVTN family beta-propeller protein